MKTNRKIWILAMVCIFVLVQSVHAEMVEFGWDPSNSTYVEGYKIYRGNESRWYYKSGDYNSRHIEVLGQNNTTAIMDLERGKEHYVVCTAYDKWGRESSYSNEVHYYHSIPNSLDSDSYSASNHFNVDTAGYIKGNVDSAPSNPKDVYWKRTDLSLTQGDKVVLDLEVFCEDGDDQKTPISLYLQNAETEEWISKEKTLFVDHNYSGSVELVARKDSSNATLKVVCGHESGYYEFFNISLEYGSNSITPIRNIYLYRLVESSEGLFTARFKWNEVPEADEFIVRVAKKREKATPSEHFGSWLVSCLDPSQTHFDLNIVEELFDGVYVSVMPVVNGKEQTSIVYPYLPGNILETADDAQPPLYTQISVDSDDYYNAYYGYVYEWTVPEPDGPACMRERMDIDNNDLAGKYDDFYFIKSQYGKSLSQ